MRIAVAGGTGLVGRLVVAELARTGEQPVVLARSTGVDLTTGVGLDDALTGVDTVIDVTNSGSSDARTAMEFFATASGNLLGAGARAGVRHHVTLSIVGIDNIDHGYYRAKVHQERMALDSPVPSTVLRATQFFEFAGQVLDRGGFVTLAPQMLSQPVAAWEVARRLVEVARDAPAGRVPDLGGPEVHKMPDLVRSLARARGHRRVVIPVRIPGAAGRAMAGGALLLGADGQVGETTFAQWLRTATS